MKRVSGGFTIVESMIVLGVTGVLFLSLVGMVSGQQQKARFKSAMTDITTKIQSQINEVATGYYPNQGNFRCQATNGVVSVSSGSSALGTNAGCTFLGRAMMFAIPATDPEQYLVQTLVGARKTAGGTDPATIKETGTRVLAPGATYGNSWPDLSSKEQLRFGTTVAWMRSLDGGGPGVPENITGIAIVAAPNQQLTFSQNGSVESGTIVPSIIPIPRSGVGTVGASATAGVDLLTRSLGVSGATGITADASDGPVEICFRSGTTNQSGLVTIGRNNSTTSVEFTIHNNASCS